MKQKIKFNKNKLNEKKNKIDNVNNFQEKKMVK